MVVATMRKSLLTVFMVLTITVGLITGFAHTKAVVLPHTTIRTTHGQMASWCPAPPKVCVPVG